MKGEFTERWHHSGQRNKQIVPLQSEKDEFWFPFLTASQQVALEAPFFHSVEQEERYLKNAKKRERKKKNRRIT